MKNNPNGMYIRRRDFIKTTTLAGMAATIPTGAIAAADIAGQGAAAGSRPSPAGTKRNVLFISNDPANHEKLLESVRSVKEFEFQVTPVKADFQKPQEVAGILKEREADAFLMCMPNIGISSARFADYVDTLQVPLIVLPPILELIMLEADLVANLRMKGVNALLANSVDHVSELLKILAAPRILEGKKALIFGRPFDSSSVPAHHLDADYINRHTGVRLEYRPISELKPLLATVDEAKARAEMLRWKNEAASILEPSDEAILKASRMYALLRSIVDSEGLSAISIDCLSFSFEQNPLVPLPCLAFSRLRDEGIAAPCEADVCMLLSSMLLQEISRKPSYFFNVSSVDIPRSSTVLRHCVAPIRLLGPDADPLPYNLRDYHGFGRDVVPEVSFPLGMAITLGGFSKDLRSFVLWPGRTISGVEDTATPSFENVPDSAPATMKNMRRFCSNRMEVKIKEADRFLHSIAGIHNVLVAGSYTTALYDAMMRMNVRVIAPPDLEPPEA